MKIRVDNRSRHQFVCTGSWGSQLECRTSTVIPAGTAVEIGTIESPNMVLNKNGNWGWWYVQDSLNHAVVEFFTYVDPLDHSRDHASAGLRGNNSHNKDRMQGATPNPLPKYLEARRDESSFTLVVKPEWTSSPPDHIFNYGRYGLGRPEVAAHSFVRAVSFDGTRTVNFECYGGTSDNDPATDCVYPALSFVASEAQLRLARTICCFDPDDKPTGYGRKPKLSPPQPSGRLRLGDCSGIVYLHSGVCHQMANRICAAVTDLDVGDLADMAMYNATSLIWGAHGKPPPPQGPKPVWDTVYNAFAGQAALTEAQLEALGVRKDAPYPVNLLFRPWDEYLVECRKLAQAHEQRG